MIGRGVVPPVLHDPERRKELGLPDDEKTPGRYMIELNILYRGGLHEAGKAFIKLCEEVLGLGLPETHADLEELLPGSAQREPMARVVEGGRRSS